MLFHSLEWRVNDFDILVDVAWITKGDDIVKELRETLETVLSIFGVATIYYFILSSNNELQKLLVIGWIIIIVALILSFVFQFRERR